MAFIDTLFSIDSELGETDVEGMKFLCRGLLPTKKLDKVDSGRELFDALMNTDLINEEDDFLLVELLYLTGQHSLLKKLNTNKERVKEHLPAFRKTSPYRQMLFEISENISSKEHEEIIFLLKLTRRFGKNSSSLELLNYLEKAEKISEDNINTLEDVLKKVSPDLLKITAAYKSLKEQQTQGLNRIANMSTMPEHESEDLQKPPFSIQISRIQSPCDDDSRMESMQVIVQEVHSEGEGKDDKAANIESQVRELSLNEDRTSATNHETFAYEMNRKHRGYCLIISNNDFANSPQRKGTEIDAEELTNVFTWLGFDMAAYTEQMSENIKSCMEDFSKRDHSDRDCFVCCIMTHGESGTVLGTDNVNVSISDIITYFIPKNCPTLAGKPKLFFIQACQGTTPQNAYPIEKDAAASGFKKNYVPCIPGDADLLIGMSTVDGHCSYRHVREGSWYIQALCDNLADLVPKGEDLLSILTRVNNDVSQKLDPQNNGKQIPQPVYTLRKKVVFPKPAKPYKSKGGRVYTLI